MPREKLLRIYKSTAPKVWWSFDHAGPRPNDPVAPPWKFIPASHPSGESPLNECSVATQSLSCVLSFVWTWGSFLLLFWPPFSLRRLVPVYMIHICRRYYRMIVGWPLWIGTWLPPTFDNLLDLYYIRMHSRSGSRRTWYGRYVMMCADISETFLRYYELMRFATIINMDFWERPY